jgi:hypothetical protein
VRKGKTQSALRVDAVRSDRGEPARPVKSIEKIALFMQQDVLRQIIARLLECGLGRNAVSRRTDFDIADAVSAISAAPDPKACSRIFRKAIAAFDIDAFASGEIDLAALERTVSMPSAGRTLGTSFMSAPA